MQIETKGKTYVSLKIKKLDKYNSRCVHEQEKLLKRLKRKETRFSRKLKKSDSAAYARYQAESLSYDSIGKLAASDTSAFITKSLAKRNTELDSLKKISSFVSSKVALPGDAASAGTPPELDKLQHDLNYRNGINDLIAKRTSFLKGLAINGQQLPGFTGIEKQVFYGKAKMKVFREMEEEPSLAEDRALEYLQGTEGFDKYMNQMGGGEGMQGMVGADAGQLEKMGYQTKQQMQKNLQAKFGESLGGVGKQMGGALNKWQQQQSQFADIKQTKQTLKNARQTDKPSFKVNPMRGLPFCKRLEKQYNYQATRATGEQPAKLEASAMVGFKHSPKLTYGIGIAYTEGLGQGWQRIHFSFEGIGYRTFAKWEWQYGIGAYVDYERMYKTAAFSKPRIQAADGVPTIHDTHNYTESIFIGLTKSYNINKKFNGAIQVLYDIWWQQKGLNTPIILRFVTVKK